MVNKVPYAEMSPAELLAEAAAAGLSVTAAGERLLIRGPRQAEHLGQLLLQRKAEVLPLVQAAAEPASPEAQLQQALAAHDWYHHFSDSADTRHRGERSERRLLELASQCDPAKARELWARYRPDNLHASPGTLGEELAPEEKRQPPSAEAWDTARADAVRAEALACLDRAASHHAERPARQRVLEVYRAVVRQLHANHDALLWESVEGVEALLSRWKAGGA